MASEPNKSRSSLIILGRRSRTSTRRSLKMERVLSWLLLLFSICSIAYSIDDKCAACHAVAEEIERGISNEKPRNHLDMRHRLDSKGQRKGKVIDYRVSELRVVELLDGLCEKMQDYTLEKVDSTQQQWIKVDDWDNLTNKQEARAYSKDLSTYCGRLLEETEDDLADLIKKGSIPVGGLSKVLCQDLSKHCDRASLSEFMSRDTRDVNDDDDRNGRDEL